MNKQSSWATGVLCSIPKKLFTSMTNTVCVCVCMYMCLCKCRYINLASIFCGMYSLASCTWILLWRKSSVGVLSILQTSEHPFPLHLDWLQSGSRLHTPSWTYTHSEHLLYILNHAVSLRSSKENAFFLSAAGLLRVLLVFMCVGMCVFCVLMTMITQDNLDKHYLCFVSLKHLCAFLKVGLAMQCGYVYISANWG